MLNKFFDWYNRNYRLALIATTVLFLLQLFHLYWLFTDVVLFRLTGNSYFGLQEIWGRMSVIFDYTEVPAIITTSVLYIHYLRIKFTYKNLFYLVFLNIQWLHILWITDEIVVEHIAMGHSFIEWGFWVAWIAILIDFLELPVIWDTVKESIKEVVNYVGPKNTV